MLTDTEIQTAREDLAAAFRWSARMGMHLNVKDRLEPGDAAPLLRLLNRDVRGLATRADAGQLDRALKAKPAAGLGHRLQHGGVGVDAAVHAPVFAPRGRNHARRGEERRRAWFRPCLLYTSDAADE